MPRSEGRIGLVAALSTLCLVGLLSCWDAAGPAIDVGLPSRTQSPDLSRVTEEFRERGGNAFIKLTGEPTPAALVVLASYGVAPPAGRDSIVTFRGLMIRTVWGHIGPRSVDNVAELLFVTAIEPSADSTGIVPQ